MDFKVCGEGEKDLLEFGKTLLLEQTYNSPNLPLNPGNPYNPCMDLWMSSSKMPVFPGKHIITIFMTFQPLSCVATLFKNLLI